MKSSITTSLLMVFLLFSHCAKETDNLKTNTPEFDMDLFEENIIDALTFETVGFCYVIAKDGNLARSGEIGLRRAGLDGSKGQDLDQPVYAASISKTITAIAALQLLSENGLSINTKITGFLPPTWDPGANVKTLSFKNLLQHRSGFRGFSHDYTSLKNLVEADINLADTVYDYENTNYALFRIMIPYLNGDIPLALTSDSEIDIMTSEKYRDYVQDNLFEPIGITNTDTKPIGNEPTLYYNFPNYLNTRGWTIGDRTTISGGGGWYISPFDLSMFFAFLFSTENIIDNDARETMLDNFLGWDQTSSVSNSNDYGIYYAKNGALSNNDNESVSQGVRNLIKVFPNGVHIVVMINSRGGDHDSSFGSTTLNGLVRNAFDDAWVVD